MPGERGAERASGAVADAFGHLADAEVFTAEQICGGPSARRAGIPSAARPTVRVKRSKNAERDSAAVFASLATVHERARWPCICRIAGARRASANPRSSPGGASSPWRRPQRFDEQHLHQAGEHEVAA